MTKAIWRRVGNTAVPVGEESLAALHAHKDGSEFMADTKGARNPKQLALWWCLCRLVAESGHFYDTKEKASDGLKLKTGHVNIFVDVDSNTHIVPASIAFESMAQAEFDAIFKAAVNVIADWLGNSPREVMDHFNQMVADKRYDGMRR